MKTFKNDLFSNEKVVFGIGVFHLYQVFHLFRGTIMLK
jgi:hypothetical protein